MNTLTTLYAVVALTLGLGLAGCKDKDKPAAGQPTSAAPGATTMPGAQPALPETPTGTIGPNLPPECLEYKVAIEKIAACERLPPATREALTQSFEQTAQSWAKMAAEGRAALAASCKDAAEAARASGAGC